MSEQPHDPDARVSRRRLLLGFGAFATAAVSSARVVDADSSQRSSPLVQRPFHLGPPTPRPHIQVPDHTRIGLTEKRLLGTALIDAFRRAAAPVAGLPWRALAVVAMVETGAGRASPAAIARQRITPIMGFRRDLLVALAGDPAVTEDAVTRDVPMETSLAARYFERAIPEASERSNLYSIAESLRTLPPSLYVRRLVTETEKLTASGLTEGKFAPLPADRSNFY